MRNRLYLGIDTSAYTTSMVILDEERNICFAHKIILQVPEGKRGLRQQEALFQHLKNLPLLFEAAASCLKSATLTAIGVSTKPRDMTDSYMPVFEAGISFAKATAALTGASIHTLSHQFNHLLAIDYFEKLAPNPCLALHLSGGTTELLRVDSWNPDGIALIGGTKDISFGKLLDRIGVSMGGPFPAGPWLDQLASEGQALSVRSRIHRSQAWWNLSGTETWFQKELVGKQPREVVAATLFHQIADALADMIADQSDIHQLKTVVVAGGVAASQTIQKDLSKSLKNKDLDLRFVPGPFSSDHALGCAWQAWRQSHESHQCQSN